MTLRSSLCAKDDDEYC